MNEISTLRAFLSGALSFLSPCILYLIPLYGALVAGLTVIKDKQLPTLKTSIFSGSYLAGFFLIFISVAVLSASPIGEYFFVLLDYLRIVGAVFTVVLGIFLMRVKHVVIADSRHILTYSVYCGAALIGMGFSSGWTPCTNPTLGTLLIAASTPGSMLRGATLLTVYSIGLSVPFALFGIGIVSVFIAIRKMNVPVILLRVCSGILLILFGLLLVTNNLRQLTPLLPDFRLGF